MNYLSKKTQKTVAKALLITSISGFGVGTNLSLTPSVIAQATTNADTTTSTDKVTVGNLIYSVSGNEATVTGTTATSGEVVIPSTVDISGKTYDVTTVGENAFNACTGLTSITLSDSITSLGECAFNKCSGLTSVTLSKSLSKIGFLAFNGCTGLTNVVLPSSVTSIGDWAFQGCTRLTTFDVPDSVTAIGDWAFQGCTGLTSIVLPSSVTSVGYKVFSNCPSLTGVPVAYQDSSFPEVGNLTFSLNGNTAKVVYSTDTSGEVVIPSSIDVKGVNYSVTAIGVNAFYGRGITSVVVPDTVTSIEQGAFSTCSNLTNVSLPNSVTSMKRWTFASCTDLKFVKLDSEAQLELFTSANTQFHKVVYTDRLGNNLGYYAVQDGANISKLNSSPTLGYGNFTGWQTNSSQLTSITSDTTFTALSDSDATITVPSGYDEHDYKALYDFLAQKDSTGVTNAEKCGIALTQDGINSMFISDTDLANGLTQACTNDPVDGSNTYYNGHPYIVWKDTGSGKQLYKVYLRGLKLSGSANFSDCAELSFLHLGGEYSNKTTFGESDNLTDVTVNNCAKLTNLRLANSNCSSIAVTNTPVLGILDISANPISSFNFSGVSSVVQLHLAKTNFTNIDLSALSILKKIYFENSSLEHITVAPTAPIQEVRLNKVSTLDLSNLNQVYMLVAGQEDTCSLDISNKHITDDKNLKIAKLNLTGLTASNYSVKSDSSTFKYYSYNPSMNSQLFEYTNIGSNKYNESTLELQKSNTNQVGEWVLTSRADGTTKTVYGDSLPVSKAQGYDITVNEVSASVVQPNDITVDLGTSIDDIDLPSKVDVTVGDTTTSASVQWDTNGYNGDEAGEYQIRGTLTSSEDMQGVDFPTPVINVLVKDANGNSGSSDEPTPPNDEPTDPVDNSTTPEMVQINGVAKVGNTLTAQLLDENEVPTTTDAQVSYKWYSSDSESSLYDIIIATGKSYVVKAEDLGKYIGLKATYLKNEFKALTSKVVDNANKPDTESNLDTYYSLIKVRLDSLNYTNNTTSSAIQAVLDSMKLPDNIKLSLVNNSIDKATSSKTGNFNVVIKISDGDNSKTYNYTANIAKLASSSSHHHHHSSSSSSSTNSDTTTTSDTNATDTATGTNTDSTTQTNTSTTNPGVDTKPVVTGWQKNADNSWSYKDSTGAIKTGWLQDAHGTWYHLDQRGIMETGWSKDTNNNWYYLNPNGAMAIGWVNVNSNWYHLDNSGAMQTGWVKNATGTWYYLYQDGSMARDTVVDGYTLDSTGACIY